MVEMVDVATECHLLEHEPISTPVFTSTPCKSTPSKGTDVDLSCCSEYLPTSDITEESESELTMDSCDITNTMSDEYLIVSIECLWELLDKCPKCTHPCSLSVARKMGTFWSIRRSCCLCDFDTTWNSQKFNKSVPLGNITLAAAIHFNGGSATKMFRILDTMKIPRISESLYWQYQRTYLQPAVWHVWKEQQAFYEDELKCLGGSRTDSPPNTALIHG